MNQYHIESHKYSAFKIEIKIMQLSKIKLLHMCLFASLSSIFNTCKGIASV